MKIHLLSLSPLQTQLALALHELGYTLSASLSQGQSLPEALEGVPVRIVPENEIQPADYQFIITNENQPKPQTDSHKFLSLAEFIAQHSQHKTRVVVSGNYGKTTLIAMALHAGQYAGKKIDFFLKDALNGRAISLSHSAEFIIIEADLPQSKTDFSFAPTVAVISNAAEANELAASLLINEITQGGILIYNQECPALVQAAQNTENPIRKIGYQTPDFQIIQQETFWQTSEGEMPLKIFGAYNLTHAEGAKWLCQNMGIDPEEFFQALENFEPLPLHLEKIKTPNNTLIFRDLAQTPEQISAVVSAVKAQFPTQEIFVALDCSQTANLSEEWLWKIAQACQSAQELIIFSPHPLKKTENASVFSDADAFSAYLKEKNTPKSVLLLCGKNNNFKI